MQQLAALLFLVFVRSPYQASEAVQPFMQPGFPVLHFTFSVEISEARLLEGTLFTIAIYLFSNSDVFQSDRLQHLLRSINSLTIGSSSSKFCIHLTRHHLSSLRALRFSARIRFAVDVLQYTE